MSAIDYTKAYITHNDGKSLATIDENNNFVDLGTFIDSGGNDLFESLWVSFWQGWRDLFNTTKWRQQ